MSLRIRGLRSALAVALSLPIVPLCYLAVAGDAAAMPTAPGSACAADGGCMKCTTDSCGLLGINEALYKVGSYEFTRCVNYDNTPPGHCARVTQTQYDIMVVFRNGYAEKIGACMKSNCAASMIYPTRPCESGTTTPL